MDTGIFHNLLEALGQRSHKGFSAQGVFHNVQLFRNIFDLKEIWRKLLTGIQMWLSHNVCERAVISPDNELMTLKPVAEPIAHSLLQSQKFESVCCLAAAEILTSKEYRSYSLFSSWHLG